MRKQQHHAAESLPLVFTTGNELIDDHLSDVNKVTELSFPDHKSVWTVEAIAVLKTKYANFRQRTIVDLNMFRTSSHLLQTNPNSPIVEVVESGMAMTECSSANILPAEPHMSPLLYEGSEGSHFCPTPVKEHLTSRHLPAGFQNRFNFWMRLEPFRR